ncbi:MAG: hypothetical protein AAGF93_24320 [Cyanobacteria bacterium P01_H01_bin.105]
MVDHRLRLFVLQAIAFICREPWNALITRTRSAISAKFTEF